MRNSELKRSFFGNRISSSLRNKPEGYFGKQRTGLGLLWGLKAGEIKKLRTDWFLKLERTRMQRRGWLLWERWCFCKRTDSLAVVHGKAIGLPA